MRRVAACVAALVMVTSPAWAQWPSHPTPNVPRSPEGQPDLRGPTPRMRDGRPDFSGVWENYRPAEGTPRSINNAFFADRPTSLIDLFRDAGAEMEGGLPYQPWAEALVRQRVATDSRDNPDAHCLPLGFMQLHTHPQPRKLVQTDRVLLMLYEANDGIRQILIDGRPAPADDPQPWWYGYTRGWWEGDTLVAETTHLRDGLWLDVSGSPLTEAATVTERFQRPDAGTLHIEITVDDPKAYTRPWTVRLTQKLMPDTELIEFVCNENQKFGSPTP